MNNELFKQLSSVVISFVFIFFSYRLGKKGKLSFRYATGWILLFGVGLFSVVLIPIDGPIGELLELSPAAIIAGLGLLLLLAICIQLSVSISGLQEQVRTLGEEIAILKSQSDSEFTSDED